MRKILINKILTKLYIVYVNHIFKFGENESKNYNMEIFKKYQSFIKKNNKINYTVEFIDIPQDDSIHKWVGGQIYNNSFICIPNDSSCFLKLNIDDRTVNKIDISNANLFKWSGGALVESKIYIFPRTENKCLTYDFQTYKIKKIDLGDCKKVEHHYGGVIYLNKLVYQPPRNSNYIFVWSLDGKDKYKIYITHPRINVKLRYSGSIIHPNGYIYFFPEGNTRVIKLNPATNKWRFIGKPISTMTFDAKIGVDGNIYGFSAYRNGLLKINVMNDKVEMIHTNISIKAYGTKLGLNGNLYSVPGDGNTIYEYNIEKDIIRKYYSIKSNNNAKYAGGAIAKTGNIYFTPAKSDKILNLQASKNIDIPNDLYHTFFCDNY